MAVAVFSPILGLCSENTPRNVTEEKTVVITKVLSDGSVVTETLDSESELSLDNIIHGQSAKKVGETNSPEAFRPIMLGMELSTGVDLSALDLSTLNFDFLVGYRNSFINLLGVQFGIHKSLGSRDSFLPICAVFRSSFTRKPAPVFMHINAGYSFNTISSSKMFGDITAAVGCGVKLTQRPKFQSNIILSFGFRHFNQRHRLMTRIDKPNTAYAQISFGVSM